MDLVWLLGLIASLCITLQVLPQTYKMWILRHKRLEEFHPLWFTFGIIGSILFVWYGVLIEQIGLIILNAICLTSLVIMLLTYLGVWRHEE